METTTCGSGKWCELGKCVSNSNVPQGDCVIEDDRAFCDSLTRRYGKNTVCSLYYRGRCCQYCNPNARLIPRLGSFSDLMSIKAGSNVKTISNVPCVDLSWCSNVEQWKTKYSDICTGSYTYQQQNIKMSCPRACGLC